MLVDNQQQQVIIDGQAYKGDTGTLNIPGRLTYEGQQQVKALSALNHCTVCRVTLCCCSG
jgi:hypothetical protein